MLSKLSLSLKNSFQIWDYSLGNKNKIFSAPAISDDGKTLYVTSTDLFLYSFDITVRIEWARMLLNTPGPRTPVH